MKNLVLIGFIVITIGGFGQSPMPDEISRPDRIISVTATLNCSIDSAFAQFSDNTKLEGWLAVKADVEMSPGGKYELFWSPDDPDLTNQSTYGCRVLAVDAPNFFNIEWRGNTEHKNFMNNIRPLTNVSVIFVKIGSHKTKVTLLHTGWRLGKDWDQAYNFFVTAWARAFKVLENRVNQYKTSDDFSLFCYYLKLNTKYFDADAWTDEAMEAIDKHSSWLDNLGVNGVLLFAGRTTVQPGDEDLFGIAVIKAKDIEEARLIMADDPSVVAGIHSAKVLPYSLSIKHFENLNSE